MQNNKIFINIASYRDPLLPYTIQNLIDNADFPGNLTFGVCWQKGSEETIELPEDANIKKIVVPPETAKGACWARSLAFQLIEDESFFFLVDSHMLPMKGWDSFLLKNYSQIERKPGVICCAASEWMVESGTMSGWGDGRNDVHAIPGASGHWGNILCQMFSEKDNKDHPYLGCFITCCNLFGPSEWVFDVPYDPDLYFLGEEISLALRSFTKGYNLYHTGKDIISHKHDRAFRRGYYEDHMKHYIALQDENSIRTDFLWGHITEPYDMGIYGFGNVRTREQYEKYAGINFLENSYNEKASEGIPDERYL